MNKRSPAMVLVLTVVTLGIYSIYWLYITRKELKAKVGASDTSWPVSYLFAPFALILLMFFVMLLVQSSPNQMTGFSAIYFLVGAIAVLLLIVLPFIWFHKFTKLVTLATPKSENNLYLFWVLFYLFQVSFIWPTLVQSHLNSHVDEDQTTPTPAPSTPITPSTPPPVAPVASPANTDTPANPTSV